MKALSANERTLSSFATYEVLSSTRSGRTSAPIDATSHIFRAVRKLRQQLSRCNP